MFCEFGTPAFPFFFFIFYAERSNLPMCDSNSGDVIEHLAYIDDYLLAIATYRAARQRWPDAYIELWQGERLIGHNRHNELP